MKPLDFAHRTWIADCLLQSVSAEQIKDRLVSEGYDGNEIDQEIAAARQHPYMFAALRHVYALAKRESLLKTLDYYQRHDLSSLQIERTPLPLYREFLHEYVYRSRPGIFTGAFDHWAARQWTPQTLLAKVGAQTPVEVQVGRDSEREYELNRMKLKRTMAFGDFITQVETFVGNDIYMAAHNQVLDTPEFEFLKGDTGNIGNDYLAEEQKSSLFLWIGPAGTVTPMHHDLTHNIFFQVYGRKRFYLIPAIEAPYMYNHKMSSYSPIDPRAPDLAQYPEFANAQLFEVTLDAGDMMYLPIGWWHYVVSETPSISLSTTRLNGLTNNFIGYPSGETQEMY